MHIFKEISDFSTSVMWWNGVEKVKLTYFDAYLWQTMWNHAKKSMEEPKHSDSVFLQWDYAENVKKTQN